MGDTNRYRAAFYGPPQGGTGASGLQTVNQFAPMGVDRYADQGGYASEWPARGASQTSGPQAQRNLNDTFDAGARSADNQNCDSAQAGVPELRNYMRQAPPDSKTDLNPQTWYAGECERNGDGRPGGNAPIAPGGKPAISVPQARPPMLGGLRPDGRRQR